MTFLNKPTIFLLGVVAGLGLAFVFISVFTDTATDSATTEQITQVAEAAIDPFVDFEIPMNDRINARIRNYLRAAPKADLLATYQRSGKYLPMIQAVFEEYNLPQFLAFLPIIESRFLPDSQSRMGAVGLWQIMPATAMDFGLKINRWIDERRDPEKATVVAAEYLQFLYARLGSWDLALAAYNCGYHKLRRIIRREKTSNYWELKNIPRETYNFLPKFYAILHIFANTDKYGVKLPERTLPVAYETIEIEATFSIAQIARLANVSADVIKRFNPALTAEIAPSGKYSIRVPVGVKEHFVQQYKANPPDQVEITYTTYRVKRGDTLGKIAKRFKTTVGAIKSDNNLRSSRWIDVGMELQIAYVEVVKDTATAEEIALESANETGEKPKPGELRFIYRVERNNLSLKTVGRYYGVTADELKTWNPGLTSKSLKRGKKLRIYKPKNRVALHKTRRGDSLWRLARRYNTTVSNLRRWNQIRGSKIYPGDRLVVALK